MYTILPEFEFNEEQLNNIASLIKKTGLCTDTVKILYGRGVDTEEKIKAFLSPSKQHFISPFKMSGMNEAVKLITRARDEEWSVVVYGDYDADGVCASTIMRKVLTDFGIDPFVYVPERRNGYGLNTAAIDEIFSEHFPQLFITVDCGISNAAEVEYIKEQGAEVIVTDHHELPDKLPDCVCVNPKFNDGYPYDNLCGAGVAFKVGCALNGESAYKYLDFAAIATVADSVPLTGENRDIVAEGLKIINNSPNKCYAGFLNKNGEEISAQSLAFSIVPKINAAGRMGDAKAALELFCEEDERKIFDMTVKLTDYNFERQRCCDELYASAKSKLQEIGAYGKVIMLWDESWNTGFVGIVAARLVEEYSRPALLFVKNGDMLKGSARSVESVNIFEALKACSEHISEFGGHSQAAGVNIKTENFPALEKALNDYLKQKYPTGAFQPTYYISGELNGEPSLKFVKELELLEPYGVGNKRPLFLVKAEECSLRPAKQNPQHIIVNCGGVDMMYFSGARSAPVLAGAIPKNIVFEYGLSTFHGKQSVKGYIKSVIYPKDAGAYVPESIALNNLFSTSLPSIKCGVRRINKAQAQQMLNEEEGYGTLFIANEFSTLEYFEGIEKEEVNVFFPASRNLSKTVLLSPRSDCDLSGYNKIVFLDKPIRVTQPSLEGKKIYVCDGYDGVTSLRSIDVSRNAMKVVFRHLKAAGGNLEGATWEEIAIKNDLGTDPLQALFAMLVFKELGLISVKNGGVVVYRGVKTELTRSRLYNTIKNLSVKL